MSQPCPCGSGNSFETCCQPYLKREKSAPSAEALMRSRFSAFATGHVEYLLLTRHASTKMMDTREDLQKSVAETDWCSLQIIATQQQHNRGEVEFAAFYRASNNGNDGGYGQIHERSQFIEEDGQWFYIDGIHLPPLKLQRNDPCWCGSGKKLKKCCG